MCLRLRPGTRRETRELTIMYLCWCDQQKRLQAYIANLKTHLVRQIQVRLRVVIVLNCTMAQCMSACVIV